MSTVWELSANQLIEDGIDVYPPAGHVGECKENYCVLKESGSTSMTGMSTQKSFFTLYCYVPKKAYTELRIYVDACKDSMMKLAPTLMPTGLETPAFYDDTVKGHMISVQYRNLRRNNLL